MKIKDADHITVLLTELTIALKQDNLWQLQPPSADKLLSSAPFCYDTLTFSQWLQFIFIPKMLLLITEKSVLPNKIALTPMAEEAFKDLASQSNDLLDVIAKIDKTLAA
jgi:uncharacterized protein YqcC (DUF446 family)